MKITGITNIGNIRSTNEDTLLISCEKRPYFMLVADGMGGHAAGEVASGIAAAEIKNYINGLNLSSLEKSHISDAVQFANSAIMKKVEENPALKGMGTTLTFAYAENSSLKIAQVGDSGAYLYSKGNVKKITKDHTYLQHLIDCGVIIDDVEGDYPFKNVITRALGMNGLEVDFYDETWEVGDILLLCSDGLTAYVDLLRMQQEFESGVEIETIAENLVNFALKSGGKDNITVVVVKNISEESSGNV